MGIVGDVRRSHAQAAVCRIPIVIACPGKGLGQILQDIAIDRILLPAVIATGIPVEIHLRPVHQVCGLGVGKVGTEQVIRAVRLNNLRIMDGNAGNFLGAFPR